MPRPDGCCGVCPPFTKPNEEEIVGYDCTCNNNPRCPNHVTYASREEVMEIAKRVMDEFSGTLDLLEAYDKGDPEAVRRIEEFCEKEHEGES